MAHQKKIELISQFKKTYSTLTNGFKLAMVNDGVTKLGDTSLINKINIGTVSTLDKTEFVKELSKVFQISKIYEPSEFSNANYTTLDGTPLSTYTDIDGRLVAVLNDGTIFWFSLWKDVTNTLTDGSSKVNIYGSVMIDINGDKKPNKMGRDVFQFYIADDGGVYPVGGKMTTGMPDWRTTGDCSTSSSGESCAARIIDEGWEMKY